VLLLFKIEELEVTHALNEKPNCSRGRRQSQPETQAMKAGLEACCEREELSTPLERSHEREIALMRKLLIKALGRSLTSAGRKALTSAELLRRKQHPVIDAIGKGYLLQDCPATRVPG